MEFNNYQGHAHATAIYPGKHTDTGLAYVALGLAGEAGEFAEKVKKKLRDGTWSPVLAAKELGDVLWYIAAACDELDVSMDYIAQQNLEKLAARKENGTLQGSGDTR
jgi:NTP pyrophosphatase (non-canonical NTP hydrolase)